MRTETYSSTYIVVKCTSHRSLPLIQYSATANLVRTARDARWSTPSAVISWTTVGSLKATPRMPSTSLDPSVGARVGVMNQTVPPRRCYETTLRYVFPSMHFPPIILRARSSQKCSRYDDEQHTVGTLGTGHVALQPVALDFTQRQRQPGNLPSQYHSRVPSDSGSALFQRVLDNVRSASSIPGNRDLQDTVASQQHVQPVRHTLHCLLHAHISVQRTGAVHVVDVQFCQQDNRHPLLHVPTSADSKTVHGIPNRDDRSTPSCVPTVATSQSNAQVRAQCSGKT